MTKAKQIQNTNLNTFLRVMGFENEQQFDEWYASKIIITKQSPVISVENFLKTYND